MKKRTIIIKLAVFILSVILINTASYFFFYRLDFTADKSYSLSSATISILKNINNKVHVTAYFSEDVPTQLLKSEKDFRDLLAEYKSRSRGNLTYSFINPNENEPQEKLAQAEGIRPVMVSVSERDQEKQMRAYMGASVEINGQKEGIAMIQPGESAEYALTTLIKKLTNKDKRKIAFLQGHGEYPFYALKQVVEQLSVSYQVEDLTVTDTSDIPLNFKTLIIVDPKDSIPPSHFNKINAFLQRGGSVLVAYSNLLGNLNQPVLQNLPDSTMRNWLSGLGINISNDCVVDVQCRRVVAPTPQGSVVTRFPFFPVVKNFEKHPATKGIEAAFFPFLNSISITQVNPSVKITPLAYSSERSGLLMPPLMIDLAKKWSADEFNKGPQVIEAALEGPITGSGLAKMIVFSNGKFAVNSEPGQEELNKDNVNLFSNAVDWLSDDTGLIELRTKEVTYRTLDPVDDAKRELIKYLNVFLPIVLALLIGLIRRYQNGKKRMSLLQSNY
jgi:gliding-associated putative ABC transporter substrate-binding component GldG